MLIGHTMEALKAFKIIGNQNDGRAVFLFIPNRYRVTKGFKFHARPQTGAYSCFRLNALEQLSDPLKPATVLNLKTVTFNHITLFKL